MANVSEEKQVVEAEQIDGVVVVSGNVGQGGTYNTDETVWKVCDGFV